MNELSHYTCSKCRVCHEVCEPRADAERLRCPDCRLAFWSTAFHGKKSTRVGIRPEELERVERAKQAEEDARQDRFKRLIRGAA